MSLSTASFVHGIFGDFSVKYKYPSIVCGIFQIYVVQINGKCICQIPTMILKGNSPHLPPGMDKIIPAKTPFFGKSVSLQQKGGRKLCGAFRLDT